MKQLNQFQQFAENLYHENLRGFYELESMRYSIMARIGLNKPDALELAVRIVAAGERPNTSSPNTSRGNNDAMQSEKRQRATV